MVPRNSDRGMIQNGVRSLQQGIVRYGRMKIYCPYCWELTLLVDVNPCRTAVPFWGQTTWNLCDLSPKRDCRTVRVNNTEVVPGIYLVVVLVADSGGSKRGQKRP